LNDTPTRHPPIRLFTYGLPSLVSSVAALPLVLFVPAFYADDLGVPLAAVGVALAASRLLDVVTDPLAQALDRVVREYSFRAITDGKDAICS
jgi:Na+/melibiose symporter-like transporter